MKILTPLVFLALFTFAVLFSAVVVSAGTRTKSPFQNALERRQKHSEDVTVEDIEKMSIPDLREHLSWRGELCRDCDMHPAKMKEKLLEHVAAGTEVTTEKYTETSARLRNLRRYKTPNDKVVKGNELPHEDDPAHPQHPQYDHWSPEAKLRRFEARRKKHEAPSDPLRSLKDVMGAHGYDTRNHPITTRNHAGHKELHDFIADHKKRAREYDEGRNAAYINAQEQVYRDKQREKEERERSRRQAGDL